MLSALHTSLMVARINLKVMSTTRAMNGQRHLAAMLIAHDRQAQRVQLI